MQSAFLWQSCVLIAHFNLFKMAKRNAWQHCTTVWCSVIRFPGEIFLKTVLINIIAEITNLFMPVFTITCIAANRIYTKAICFIAFVLRRRITFVNIVAFISHGMIPSDALALIWTRKIMTLRIFLAFSFAIQSPIKTFVYITTNKITRLDMELWIR